MIDTIFIATGNTHKKKEIEDIFKKNDFNVLVKTPKDFNNSNEPIEDGLSFKENAYIKAKYFFDLYHLPCIGEDSGITIEYLNNLPGIHSKRFMSNLSDFDKNEYVLYLMKDIKNRKAQFHCMICYIDSKGNDHYFEGINNGEISLKQRGDEGFGYDPIFLIPEFNKTEAELGQDYKNENAHRAKAFKKLIDYLKNEKY